MDLKDVTLTEEELDRLEELKQKYQEMKSEGPTIAQYLENFEDCYPYLSKS